MHPRRPTQAVGSLPQRAQRREKARRRPGCSHEKLGLARGNLPAVAPHREDAVVGVQVIGPFPNFETKLAQAIHHHPRVLRPKRPVQLGGSLRKRRKDERAVGEALGAGDADHGVQWTLHRANRKWVGKR